MRNISDKSWGDHNTFMFSNFFFRKIVPLMRSCEKNVVVSDKPRMTIWRMRIACWIPQATNPHSEYVIRIAFPTATAVVRTRLSVTVYVAHCLSCLLFIAISTWRALGSRTSGSALYLTLTPISFSNWGKWILHLTKILWASVTPDASHLLLSSSRLVTLLRVTDAPIRVSYILILLLFSSSLILDFRYSIFLSWNAY
jgi:hypothetical protein